MSKSDDDLIRELCPELVLELELKKRVLDHSVNAIFDTEREEREILQRDCDRIIAIRTAFLKLAREKERAYEIIQHCEQMLKAGRSTVEVLDYIWGFTGNSYPKTTKEAPDGRSV